LEPGTHPPVGQSSARKDNTLIMLEPGETRKYELRIAVTGNTVVDALLEVVATTPSEAPVQGELF